MPLNLKSVPVSQIKSVPSQRRSSSTKSPQQKATTPKRTTVTVATYGGKLFEPVMSREKPIYVHFENFVLQDDISITRFSQDGFFAIKYIIREHRCYLLYFLNPISPTKETTIESACQEAIEFHIYEFFDSEAFIKATQCRSFEEIIRLRSESALYQLEQKIIVLLREKILAEKFLKQQLAFEQQDKEWKAEFLKQQKQEEEEERRRQENVELDNSISESNSDGLESENDGECETEEEVEKVFEEARQEEGRDKLQSEENRERAGIEKKAFSWGRKN